MRLFKLICGLLAEWRLYWGRLTLLPVVDPDEWEAMSNAAFMTRVIEGFENPSRKLGWFQYFDRVHNGVVIMSWLTHASQKARNGDGEDSSWVDTAAIEIKSFICHPQEISPDECTRAIKRWRKLAKREGKSAKVIPFPHNH